METEKYVFFVGHKPNKIGVQFFSQWYPCTFVEDFNEETNITYSCAEQYMMAHKALLFGDHQIYDQVMKSNNQDEIKSLGRKIKGFNQQIWDEHKFNIVVNGNRLKFEQNPQMMVRLLETGSKTIVEAAHYDKIWGIGLRAEDAVKIPESKWPGENLLGKALMVVRDELNRKFENILH